MAFRSSAMFPESQSPPDTGASGVSTIVASRSRKLCTVIQSIEASTVELHADDGQHVAEVRGDASRAQTAYAVSYRLLVDGGWRWVEELVFSVSDGQNAGNDWVGTVSDIRVSDKFRKSSEAHEVRLNAALTVGRMVVWDLDLASGIVTRSANAKDLLGTCKEPIEAFLGRVHPEDLDRVRWENAPNPVPPKGDVRFRYFHPDGSLLWLETSATTIQTDDQPGHVIGITSDVTRRHLAEERLIHAASHDDLTGLMSRKAWTAELVHRADACTSGHQRFHLLLLDVDRFKLINDTFGHDAGDHVLREIGSRMRAALSRDGTAARLGGDEFAAVLLMENTQDALQLAENVIGALRKPIRYGDVEISSGASAGLACFPDHGLTAHDLSKNADLALYTAKQNGRQQVRQFENGMRQSLDALTALDAEFRKALEAHQIVPYYQPKIDLTTGALIGFEALARWQHPTRGLLTPAVFGALFEDGGNARRIGQVIRRAVFQDIVAWQSRDLAFGRIAINFAADEFRSHDLARAVLAELDQSNLSTSCLGIEVTEGVMVGRDAEVVERVLNDFHASGIQISLDDFGTGYASLIHLKQFPVDEIKIDKSFVAEIDKPPSRAIIRAILVMAQSLGLTTVAEGIETAAQRDALRQMGCTQGQGYFIGKPMSRDRVPWFIEKQRNPILQNTPSAIGSSARPR
ncbi:putative bifunctional diguanylate cyclase/phosphodiesterase [Lichenifustis flavocetrariae]|uniref:EAL domain-containing protein n=1 Tax=Lichenifustis flavocetrariae TaxID=2949735 RepID=A0AA42CMK7_9HYPH|nr:GGDEF and EAL domain-containing protein [Lichenifustis flavocetrariae]MCW6512784.1 EAL domain-containing protein [Lichenifustis flavocetrariae]